MTKGNYTFRKIIKNNKGESLAETLISVVIAASALLILAGALVSAFKVNNKVQEAYTFMDSQKSISSSGSYSDVILIKRSGGGAGIKISDLDGTKIKLYTDEYVINGEGSYYYYWIPEIQETSN